MFGSRLQVGQQVRAVHDVDSWLGARQVRRGQRGIVRAVEPGFLFGTRYVVEFADGLGTHTVRVGEGDVRRRAFDGGPDGWARSRTWEVGVRLGLFLAFGVPALFALARYFLLEDGTLPELIAELPVAALDFSLQILSVLGLPLVLILGGALYLVHRSRK